MRHSKDVEKMGAVINQEVDTKDKHSRGTARDRDLIAARGNAKAVGEGPSASHGAAVADNTAATT